MWPLNLSGVKYEEREEGPATELNSKHLIAIDTSVSGLFSRILQLRAEQPTVIDKICQRIPMSDFGF